MNNVITINPSTEETLQTYPQITEQQAQQIINQTHAAFNQWQNTDFNHRRQLMLTLANLLKDRRQNCAELITREMGKPITQSLAEIDKCVWHAEHYANHTEKYLADQKIKTQSNKSYVRYCPLGIIFAIMPWNFPFWQVLRFAIPNLMAGNAVILKHPAVCTGAGVAIEQLIKDAGFTENIFQSAVMSNEIASLMIRDTKIRGITLTGSDRTGKVIARQAGEHLKKVVLELGGNDPYLILKDADLEFAAKTCVAGRFYVSGQVCISPKRLIIDKSIADEFTDLILQQAKTFQYGDPLQPETLMGPLARDDLRQTLHQQVQDSIKKGAKCLLGGEIPKGRGFFYPATVLNHVKRGQPAYNEELFGPVLSLMTADNEAEAIAIANDSRFGLGAGVFTQNIKRGEEIAAKYLQAGTCNVNSLVGSDPRLPFGGIKDSGIGREMAPPGIYEFMNVKTVIVK